MQMVPQAEGLQSMILRELIYGNTTNTGGGGALSVVIR